MDALIWLRPPKGGQISLLSAYPRTFVLLPIIAVPFSLLCLAGLMQSLLCMGLNHTDQLDVFRALALQPVAQHEMVIKL